MHLSVMSLIWIVEHQLAKGEVAVGHFYDLYPVFGVGTAWDSIDIALTVQGFIAVCSVWCYWLLSLFHNGAGSVCIQVHGIDC